MHPYMIELLARQREAELRRSALRHGPPVPRRRRGRRRSVSNRAGWALVAIGLTLAPRIRRCLTPSPARPGP